MDNQGEGNREADEKYRKGVRETVKNEDVEELAREARPVDAEEADELSDAEAEGRSKAKELEPGSDQR